MSTAARNLTLTAHLGAGKHANALGTLYVAAVLGDPRAGAVTEPDSSGGYGRVALANDATTWGTIGTGDVQATAIVDLVWPTATALWSLAEVDHWAVYDLAAGGVLWYSGPLTANIAPTGVGDVPRIPAGQWSITVDA